MFKSRLANATKNGGKSGAALNAIVAKNAVDGAGAKLAASKPQKATSLSKHLAKSQLGPSPHRCADENLMKPVSMDLDVKPGAPRSKRADTAPMDGGIGKGVYYTSASQDNAAMRDRSPPRYKDGQFVFEDNRSRLGGPHAGISALQAAHRVSAAGGIFIEDERSKAASRRGDADAMASSRGPRAFPLTGHGPCLDRPHTARGDFASAGIVKPAAIAEHAFHRMRHQQAPIQAQNLPPEYQHAVVQRQLTPHSTPCRNGGEAHDIIGSPAASRQGCGVATPRRSPGNVTPSKGHSAAIHAESSRARSEEPGSRGARSGREVRYKPKPYQHMRAVDLENVPRSTSRPGNWASAKSTKLNDSNRETLPLRPGGGKDCNLQQKSMMMGGVVTDEEPSQSPRRRRSSSLPDCTSSVCAFTDSMIARYDGAAMRGVFANYKTIIDKDQERTVQPVRDRAAGGGACFVPKVGDTDPAYIKQLATDGVMPNYFDKNVTCRSMLKVTGPASTRASYATPGGFLNYRLHASTGELGSRAFREDVPPRFGPNSEGVTGCLMSEYVKGGVEANAEAREELRLLGMEKLGPGSTGDSTWAGNRGQSSSPRNGPSGPDKVEVERPGCRTLGHFRKHFGETWQTSLDHDFCEKVENLAKKSRQQKASGLYKDGPSAAMSKLAASRDPEMFRFESGSAATRSLSAPPDSYDLISPRTTFRSTTGSALSSNLDSTMLPCGFTGVEKTGEEDMLIGSCSRRDSVLQEDSGRAGLDSSSLSKRSLGWEHGEQPVLGRAHHPGHYASDGISGIIAGAHGRQATESIHMHRLANEDGYAQLCSDTFELNSRQASLASSIRNCMTVDNVKNSLVWA